VIGMQSLVDGLDTPALAVRVQNGSFVLDALNHGAERLLQCGAEEAIGRPTLEIVDPVNWGAYRQQRALVLREGVFFGRSVLLRRGTEIQIEIAAFRVVWRDEIRYLSRINRVAPSSGSPVIPIASSLSEITRDPSFAQLASLGGEDARVGMDAEFLVTSWNDGAQALFGWAAEEVLGRSAFKLILASGERQARLRALREQGAWRGTCVVSGKGGRRVPVEADIVAIPDRVGAILGYHATLRSVRDSRNSAQIAESESQVMGHDPPRGTWRDAGMERESHAVGIIQRTDRRQLVGSNIRRARNAKGLTQLALAQALRISRPRVADYEAGAHEPGWDRLVEIARITDVPEPGWFYIEHDEPE